jgi:hypothetical protein
MFICISYVEFLKYKREVPKELCSHVFEGWKLEVSRKRQRERVLNRFKYIKTCVLARELCVLVRANRVTLNKEDVHACCLFISQLCKEAGCEEQSELCGKAAEAVLTSEEKYLELCEQSCKKCGEARQPQAKTTKYVA